LENIHNSCRKSGLWSCLVILIGLYSSAVLAQKKPSILWKVVSDREVKEFLLAQKIDLNRIWLEEFVYQTSKSGENILIANKGPISDRMIDLVENVRARIEKGIDRIQDQAFEESFLKSPPKFVSLTPDEDREIVKKGVLPYFSSDSLLARSRARDPYLVEVPSLPFELRVTKSFGMIVRSFSRSAQNSAEFSRFEKDRFAPELTASFVSRHRIFFGATLGAMCLAPKVVKALNRANIITHESNSDLPRFLQEQCPSPPQQPLTDSFPKNQFIKRQNQNDALPTCRAEPISNDEGFALEIFTETCGGDYFNFLSVVEAQGVPRSLAKYILGMIAKPDEKSFPGYFLKPEWRKKIDSLNDCSCVFDTEKPGCRGFDDEIDDERDAGKANSSPPVVNRKDNYEQFLNAIAKLAPHEGIFYHGVPKGVYYLKDKYNVGDIIQFKDVVSTSIFPGTAASFAADQSSKHSDKNPRKIIFTVHVRNAKSIENFSEYPNEKEYILLPGTRLEVVSVFDNSLTDICNEQNRCKVPKNNLVKYTHVTLVEK